MPEPTSGDELGELRRLLEKLREELDAVLALPRDGEQPVKLDTAIGRLTRADAMQQQSMAKATREAAENRSRQLAAAFSRLDKGTYGECLACGEPIGLARLRVRPEATLCVECQTSRERRG